MTRTLRALGTALVLSLGTAATAAAQDFMVVINDAVPASSITAAELSRVFQKRAVRWPNGLAAEPVDLGDASPVRERFSQSVHSKSTAQVKAFWQTQIFSGRAVPPVELSSDEEVLAFVQTHAGAVGYVASGTTLPQGVRRLRVTAR